MKNKKENPLDKVNIWDLWEEFFRITLSLMRLQQVRKSEDPKSLDFTDDEGKLLNKYARYIPFLFKYVLGHERRQRNEKRQ